MTQPRDSYFATLLPSPLAGPMQASEQSPFYPNDSVFSKRAIITRGKQPGHANVLQTGDLSITDSVQSDSVATILDKLGVAYTRQPGFHGDDVLMVSLDSLSIENLCRLYKGVVALYGFDPNHFLYDNPASSPLLFTASSENLFLRFVEEIDALVSGFFKGLVPQWLTDLQSAQAMVQTQGGLSAGMRGQLTKHKKAVKTYACCSLATYLQNALSFSKVLLCDRAFENGFYILNHDTGSKMGFDLVIAYESAVNELKKGSAHIGFQLNRLGQKYNHENAETKALWKVFSRALNYTRPGFEQYHVALVGGPSLGLDDIRFATAGMSQLVTIITNLLTNACRYSNPELSEDQRMVWVDRHISQTGDLEIVVRDNGIGFAPENLERIGKEMGFREARKAIEDSHGIGLCSVYQTVRQMGWQITLQTTQGDGSTFTITIPKKDLILDL